MKIALTGASSTGKTTVAKLLADKLKIPFVGSTARSIAERVKLQPEQINNRDEFILFQKRVIEEKLLEESSYDSFITDRAYIDSIVYTLKLSMLLDSDDINFLRVYEKECIAKTHNYDILIKVPAVLPVKSDNVRKTNECVNMLVDKLNDYYFHIVCKHNNSDMLCIELKDSDIMIGNPDFTIHKILKYIDV